MNKLIRHMALMTLVFTVLLCPSILYAQSGDIWMEPGNGYVNAGQTFQISVYVDSGQYKVGAYQFVIKFDPEVFLADVNYGSYGVQAGTDGFITALKVDNDKGLITVNGFDITGKGPWSRLNMLRLYFQSTGEQKTSEIELIIKTLADIEGVKIHSESNTVKSAIEVR